MRFVHPSRHPIEGAPFAQWGIVQRQPPSGARLSYDEFPDGGDEGTASRFVGDVVLDPAERRIHVRPVLNGSYDFGSNLLEWAKRERNTGDFGLGETPESIANVSEPIEIGRLQTTWPVKRCDVLACDKFTGWHKASIALPHVAHDMSEAGFTCRLRLVKDLWVPEIDIKYTTDSIRTISEAQRLNSAIQWVLAEAQKLNTAASVAA